MEDSELPFCFTMSWIERTSSSEAMTQPGTMASSGVSAAMGIRPRSELPLSRLAAHSEGFM